MRIIAFGRNGRLSSRLSKRTRACTAMNYAPDPISSLMEPWYVHLPHDTWSLRVLSLCLLRRQCFIRYTIKYPFFSNERLLICVTPATAKKEVKIERKKRDEERERKKELFWKQSALCTALSVLRERKVEEEARTGIKGDGIGGRSGGCAK